MWFGTGHKKAVMITTTNILSNTATAVAGVDPDELSFQRLKVDIHTELVDSLNLSIIEEVSEDRFFGEVKQLAEELTAARGSDLTDHQRERMVEELIDEVFGLGPLEPLTADPAISDILVNNPYEVYVERNGLLEKTNIVFANNDHVIRIIQRLTARVGRRVDEVSPMVDARLPDGSRLNAVLPPLAIDGPGLSIRRFGTRPLDSHDLIDNGSVAPAMLEFLAAAIEARVSFLISGGTGAGKTTLLNALSAFIPSGERIITIEDSAELRLMSKHVMRMETRPPNTEGKGAITQRDLVRNALRMRPDRILVGEVRGAEALDMLQAMNTGHEGSLTTVHANNTREALARLEMMIAMSDVGIPMHVVRDYIASGIRLVVHLARLKGGPRRVMRISEIVGVENGEFHLEDIFGFNVTGVDENGVAKTAFHSTGYRPRCLERLLQSGIQLPDRVFEKVET